MAKCVRKDCLWPETEVPRCPRFGRDRVESGHSSDIAEVKRLTGPRQVDFAVMHCAFR